MTLNKGRLTCWVGKLVSYACTFPHVPFHNDFTNEPLKIGFDRE
jgi:hypothetical protein